MAAGASEWDPVSTEKLVPGSQQNGEYTHTYKNKDVFKDFTIIVSKDAKQVPYH